jgi:hypothetical protein
VTEFSAVWTYTPILEHFSNTRAVLSGVQGGFFLRKKPLGILLSLYTNWKNALLRRTSRGLPKILKRPGTLPAYPAANQQWMGSSRPVRDIDL